MVLGLFLSSNSKGTGCVAESDPMIECLRCTITVCQDPEGDRLLHLPPDGADDPLVGCREALRAHGPQDRAPDVDQVPAHWVAALS